MKNAIAVSGTSKVEISAGRSSVRLGTLAPIGRQFVIFRSLFKKLVNIQWNLPQNTTLSYYRVPFCISTANSFVKICARHA